MDITYFTFFEMFVESVQTFLLVSCGFCENGYCTGPNQCTCNIGYRKINGRCQSKSQISLQNVKVTQQHDH